MLYSGGYAQWITRNTNCNPAQKSGLRPRVHFLIVIEDTGVDEVQSDEPECQWMEHERGIAFEGEDVAKSFLSRHWYQLSWNPEHISCVLLSISFLIFKTMAIGLGQASDPFQLYPFSEFLNIFVWFPTCLCNSLPKTSHRSPYNWPHSFTDSCAWGSKPTPVSYILFCCLVSPVILIWPTEWLFPR